MNKEEYPSIGEVRYTETLPNGPRLVVVPKEGVAASYAAFATEYGGAFRRFRTGQDWLDTPAGIAHYLEHKMFDMPEGNNALEILSANGADPNAFTSSGMTVYYFESTRNFQENLEMLLKFVSTPYFTEESVEKEQGIIGQEIRQTEDSPGFEVYIQLMKLLYDHHPIRDAVAGTVESIREITPQVLYDCHRIFYHPSNMTLCVSGNVDPQEVRDIALKVLTPEPGSAPEPDFGPEDLAEPKEKRHSMTMEVAAPLFYIGAKFAPAPRGEELLRQKLTAGLVLRLLFGSSSDFYTEQYAAGLISRDFDSEADYSAGTATIIMGGESPDPEKVYEEIVKTIEKNLRFGVNPRDLSRIKKASIGARLRGLEDVEGVALSQVDGTFGGYDPLRSVEILPTITAEECNEFLKQVLAPEHLVMSLVLPKGR